jgi:hypothetical protein
MDETRIRVELAETVANEPSNIDKILKTFIPTCLFGQE